MSEEYTEARDAHRNIVLIGAGILIAMLVVGAAAIWFIYGGDLRSQMNSEPKYSETQFAEPRLQKDPPALLRELRAQENVDLSTYAWRDSSHRSARVPVDRALELIAREKMIPSQTGGQHAP